MAVLLDGPVGRWFHIATLPVLVALGAGKLATVLGGRGQGQPSDAPWATAYLGPGPWGSLAPEVPSVPSQALEGLATLAVLLLAMGVLAVPGFRRPDGRAFLMCVALWAFARAIVVSTWRDPLALGPFRTEQLIDVGIFVGCVIGIVILVRRERPASEVAATG